MGLGHKIMIAYSKEHSREGRLNVKLESNEEMMPQPTHSQFLQSKSNPHFPNQ